MELAQGWDYFDALSELSSDGGGFGDAAPGNPEPNVQGEAIGYFGAFSVSRLTMVIP